MAKRSLIIWLIVVAFGLGVYAYARHRARLEAKSGCDTPAPVQAATPPPKLPDFTVEPPCGPDGAKAPPSKK